MTCRAFLSSKSNTAAGEIQLQLACQKCWQIGPKNEDISKSVNSFHSGAIFPPSLGHDLSRNTFVVSILSFQRNHSGRKCSDHDPKSSKFSEKCSLRASCSIWAALPGAHPSGFRPQLFVRHADDLHDSQSLSSSESNTAAGEMTRRAFSALRVIRLQGQMAARRAQDFLGKLARKMIIAKNQ